jgi:hypothetical protein
VGFVEGAAVEAGALLGAGRLAKKTADVIPTPRPNPTSKTNTCERFMASPFSFRI